MAAQLPERFVRLRRQLQPLLLEDVRETGKELGRGSYGAVYEVIVSELVCAGKKQFDFLAEGRDSVFIDKFGQECLLHSQQRHPNIVQLMGIYYPSNAQLPMLVMEYLPMSLTQCLDKHENLPLQIKYSILLDVANGLNYLHCKRPPILHRDLTANNVLLTSNFVAKISDLGVSRMIDVTLRRKALQLSKAPGNAMVMPPEALKDNPVYDHRLDVFSYGCLVLHVFTQQWPYPSDQFVPSTGLFQRGTHKKVSEWDRRSKYTVMIPNDNPFWKFTESCLDDKPEKRPNISDAMRCAQRGLSTLPPLRNILDLTNLLDQMQTEKASIEDEKNTALQTIATVRAEKQQALEAAAKAENERKLAMDTAVRMEEDKSEAIKKAEKREREAIDAASKAEKEMKEALVTALKADEERKQAVETARKMEEEKTKATNEALEAERVKQRAVAAANKEKREKQQALARAAEERKQAVDLAMEEKAKAVDAAETREREALEKMKKTQTLLKEKETSFKKLKEQNDQLELSKKKQMEQLSTTWQAITRLNVQLMAKEEEVQEKLKLLEQEMARANKLGEENVVLTERANMLGEENVVLAETVSQLKENVQLEEKEINQLKNEIEELKSEITMVTMKSERQLEEIIRKNDGLRAEISRLVATLAPLQEAHCSLEKVLKIKERQLASIQHEIPSIEIQRDIVRHHMKQPLQRGDTWYLIGLYWFTQWKMYTGYEPCNQSVAGNEAFRPGAVDNTALVKAVNDCSNSLQGYAICTKPVWDFLVSWFGLSVGSEPIARNVIESNGVLKVEVNLVKLELSLYPNDDKTKKFFSCEGTFGTVTQKAREIFNVSTTDECRLWSNRKLLDDLEKTIVQSYYYSYILEVRNADGSWPMTIEVKLYIYSYTNIDTDAIPLILQPTDDTVGTAIEKAKEVLDIPETIECRLWGKTDDYHYNLLDNSNQTVYDTKFAQYKCMILEKRQSDGSWPMTRFTCTIEVKLYVYPYTGTSIPLMLYLTDDTVGTAIEKAKKVLDIHETVECRLWGGTYNYSLLDNPNQTIHDTKLARNENVILERRQSDGSWPMMIELKLSRVCSPNINDIKIISFSATDIVDNVVQKTKKLFAISATSECRLWKGCILLADLNETVATVGCYTESSYGQTSVMLEVRDPDGSWPWRKELQLCIYPHTDDTVQYSFHLQDDTINTVLQKVKELFSVPVGKECRLWSGNMLVNDFEKEVSSLFLSKYILEVKDEDTGWPKQQTTLNLSIYPDMETVRQCSFDLTKDTIGTVVQKARDLFNVATTDECRLWRKGYSTDYWRELQDLKQSIHAADKLVLEVRDPDESWPWRVKVKLCSYPNTDDIKEWSFHVQDDRATAIETAKLLFAIPALVECKLYTRRREIFNVRQLSSSDEDLIVVQQSSDGSWPVKLCTLSVYPDTYKSQDWLFDVTHDSLNTVVEKIKEFFNIPTDTQYRLWMTEYPYKLIDSSKMLCDYPEANKFLLEVNNPDGSWPKTIKLNFIPEDISCSFDPENTINTVMQKTRDLFALDTAAECRLWWEKSYSPLILLDDLKKKLHDVGMYESEYPVLLEVKDPVDGNWPLTFSLKLGIWPDIDYCNMKQCSFHFIEDNIGIVKQKMKEVFNVPKDSEVRLWKENEHAYSIPNKLMDIKRNDQLILEVKNPDGSWPWRIELSLCVYPDTSTIKRKSFHALDDTLDNVVQSMRELFNISSTYQCRLWRMESCGTLEYLYNPLKYMSYKRKSLFNANQATLVLETRHLANSWLLKITLKLCGPPYGLSQPIEYDFEEETFDTVMKTMKRLFNRSEDEKCRLMQQEDDESLTQITSLSERLYNIDTTKKLLLIGYNTARTLFDYVAEDDDEITFDEDDIIDDIEEIDEGWWRGTCNGERGLFPSNYVEKI